MPTKLATSGRPTERLRMGTFRATVRPLGQLRYASADLIEKALARATWAADTYLNGSYKVQPQIKRHNHDSVSKSTTSAPAVEN